jgi:hypothetical protein
VLEDVGGVKGKGHERNQEHELQPSHDQTSCD